MKVSKYQYKEINTWKHNKQERKMMSQAKISETLSNAFRKKNK